LSFLLITVKRFLLIKNISSKRWIEPNILLHSLQITQLTTLIIKLLLWVGFISLKSQLFLDQLSIYSTVREKEYRKKTQPMTEKCLLLKESSKFSNNWTSLSKKIINLNYKKKNGILLID